MQPAVDAIDLCRRHQVVVDVEQFQAVAAQAFENAPGDELAVTLGEAQRIGVARQVGGSFQAAVEQAGVAMQADLLLQDRLAETARATVHQQLQAAGIEAEGVQGGLVEHGLDLL